MAFPDEPLTAVSRTPLQVLVFGYGFAGAWIHDPLIRAVPGLAISAVVTSSPERQELDAARVSARTGTVVETDPAVST